MSRYGYLACHDCEICVWLGKTLFAGVLPVAFQIGQQDEPPNSKNELLSRVIWKFLADHARHRIAVVIEGDPDFDRVGEYRELGGDMEGDTSFDEYLRGFSG